VVRKSPKSLSPLVALTLAAAAGGGAMGAISQTIDLGNISFPVHGTAFGDDPVHTITIDLSPNPKTIVGIGISFNYNEDPLDNSWASDLGMTIQFGADGPVIGFGSNFRYLGALAGGYAQADALAATDLLSIWDFDGSQSNEPGFYQHKLLLGAGSGLDKPDFLVIRLTDTWNGGTSYENFTITLQKIPAPGAMALFGMAGLLGRRRRSAR